MYIYRSLKSSAREIFRANYLLSYATCTTRHCGRRDCMFLKFRNMCGSSERKMHATTTKTALPTTLQQRAVPSAHLPSMAAIDYEFMIYMSPYTSHAPSECRTGEMDDGSTTGSWSWACSQAGRGAVHGQSKVCHLAVPDRSWLRILGGANIHTAKNITCIKRRSCSNTTFLLKTHRLRTDG
jgi:hypothetical protein